MRPVYFSPATKTAFRGGKKKGERGERRFPRRCCYYPAAGRLTVEGQEKKKREKVDLKTTPY